MCSAASGGFHSSPAFLMAVADARFPGKQCSVSTVTFGAERYRLLFVDGRPLERLSEYPYFHMAIPACASDEPPAGRMPTNALVVRRTVPLVEGAVFAVHDAPFVAWRGFSSWNDYVMQCGLRGRLGRTRNLRNQLTRSVGPVEFTTRDATPGLVDLSLGWKAAQSRRNGWSSMFSWPETARVFHALHERDLLSIATMRVAGRVVAAAAWARWNGVCLMRLVATDPEISRFSVGTSLIQHLLEASCQAGDEEFDFLQGSEGFKLRYATHVRILGRAVDPRIRASWAWRTARKLPLPVRRPALGLLRRVAR